MFTQRRNRRFNYKPRFGDNEDAKKREEFIANWNSAKAANSNRGFFTNKLVWLIIVLALVLFLMYYLGTK